MIILILGLIDIFFSVFMLLGAASIVVKSILLAGAIYFLIKAILFSLAGINMGSILDLIAAVIVFVSLLFSIPHFFYLIAGAIVFQKGFFSLF